MVGGGGEGGRCAKVKLFPHGFFLFAHAEKLHGIKASHFLVWLLNRNKVHLLSWIGIRKDLHQSELLDTDPDPAPDLDAIITPLN